MTLTRHLHTEACPSGCTRTEDFEFDTRTVTGILDLREFQAELKRRGRAPRRSDGRWQAKLAVKAGLAAIQALTVLAAIGLLSLAKHCGVQLPGLGP